MNSGTKLIKLKYMCINVHTVKTTFAASIDVTGIA